MHPELLAKFEKIAEQNLATSQTAHAEIAKWILASLMALNGGAIVIFVQVATNTPKLALSTSPFLFLFGAMFAIGSGVVGLKRNELIYETYLLFLIATDDDARAARLNEGREREIFLARLWTACISLSLVCLVLGRCFSGLMPKRRPYRKSR